MSSPWHAFNFEGLLALDITARYWSDINTRYLKKRQILVGYNRQIPVRYPVSNEIQEPIMTNKTLH